MPSLLALLLAASIIISLKSVWCNNNFGTLRSTDGSLEVANSKAKSEGIQIYC